MKEPRDPEIHDGHALAGPIEVRGAHAGQVLEVRIDDVVPGPWGVTFGGPEHRVDWELEDGVGRALGLRGAAVTLSWSLALLFGALGVTILDHAKELGLGVSMFVSVGNKADVSGNKLIDYWGRDPGTRLIVMYNESFGDPRRFTRSPAAERGSNPAPLMTFACYGVMTTRPLILPSFRLS